MGLVWVEAVIRNPNTGKHATAKALVDTGATLTVLPRKIAEELQLPVIGRRRVATAKGDVDIVLIGATTLETLGLEVDPVTGKLKEATTYLL
jgi:predicted aspartyl protease